MADFESLSRCSRGSPLQFHWFDGAYHAATEAIEVAVGQCFEVLQGHNRVWNPYSETMIRAEFRKRLEAARDGLLVPVDEVKEAGRNPSIPLYEIRWQHGIQVTEKDPQTGRLSHPSLLVRMYHSEPASKPDYFIGHHAHEKRIEGDPQTIRERQTEEIRVAEHKYLLGESSEWGIFN